MYPMVCCWIDISQYDSFILHFYSDSHFYANFSTMTGPHFDYTFFITATGIVGSIMSLLSVLLFQRFFSTWRFRPAIIMTLVIGAFASMIDVIIMKVGDSLFNCCFNVFVPPLLTYTIHSHSSLPAISLS